MVRMIPDRVGHGTSSGEVEVFNHIKGWKDSDTYVCLHSIGIARHQRKEYAEADFLLVGPAGVFCLEVKGGSVVERKNGVWIIGSPNNNYKSIEGPFKQAQSARWALLKYLEQNLAGLTRKNTLFGWGVMFPDVTFTEQDPEWDNDVIYDQRDKNAPFQKYVERLEVYFRRRLEETGRLQPAKIGPARANEIAKCLRGDFEVVLSLRGLLSESEKELIALSADQFRVLDLALNEQNPRIICYGSAGTGKTLIAMEAARRLAVTGKSVLLLCFNNNLSRFLSKDVADFGDSVRITTVYRFLGDIIRRGGAGLELASAHTTISGDELFGETYQRLFETAAESLIEEGDLPQFDVVIIDEAQDVLNAAIMNCLDLILANGFSKGRWLVFMDRGLQSFVYKQLDENVLDHLKSFGPVSVVLDQNFRNPKHIVSEMCRLINAPPPICKRELTSNVEYQTYVNNNEQAKKLRSILIELMRDGVSPRHVSILSARNMEQSIFQLSPPDVGKPIYILDRQGGIIPEEAITAATISGFKGLENDFIILTDLTAPLLTSEWGRSVIYVGMTRARTKLFALVESAFLESRIQL